MYRPTTFASALYDWHRCRPKLPYRESDFSACSIWAYHVGIFCDSWYTCPFDGRKHDGLMLGCLMLLKPAWVGFSAPQTPLAGFQRKHHGRARRRLGGVDARVEERGVVESRCLCCISQSRAQDTCKHTFSNQLDKIKILFKILFTWIMSPHNTVKTTISQLIACRLSHVLLLHRRIAAQPRDSRCQYKSASILLVSADGREGCMMERWGKSGIWAWMCFWPWLRRGKPCIDNSYN